MMNTTVLSEGTNLYMIRHGETNFNRDRIVQGRGVDVPLNSRGCEQAIALGNRLKNDDISAVYSSTLLRAKQTAKILLNELGSIPHILLNDLEEISFGIYEGRSHSPILKKVFDTVIRKWNNGNYHCKFEGGESIIDLQERGIRAIDYILSRHSGQSVAVVTHGRLLRILLASLLGEYSLRQMNDMGQSNASFNHVLFSEGRFSAVKLNCTEHLAAG